jgi:hypothetical protein
VYLTKQANNKPEHGYYPDVGMMQKTAFSIAQIAPLIATKSSDELQEDK